MAYKKPFKKTRVNYNPPYDKELLNTPVTELQISEPLKEILVNGFVKDIYAVVKRSEREIFGIKFFNKKHLIELKKALALLNVEFRKEEPAEVKPDGAPSEINAERNGTERNGAVNADRPKNETNNRTNAFKNDRGNAVNGGRERVPNDRRGQDDRRQDDRRQDDRRQDGGRVTDRDNLRGRPVRQQEPEPPKKTGPLTEADWKKYTRNGRWGYIDPSTNQIKIQPVYDEVFAFKEGLACVEKNELFGYIDISNNVVIPFEFELAMSFKDGLACVTKNNKTGFIDKEGGIVIDFRFDAAMPFEDGTARVKESGKWLEIDRSGQTLKIY
ncbi:MAG: WG repeat-containing protein [Clostridiales bacterium]|jgi:hypothetical protein|nr:WG repeat-containing protein [Clostridiales bacterium]